MNRGTMDVNSLPKTVTRQRRGCDLNLGPVYASVQHADRSATEPSNIYIHVGANKLLLGRIAMRNIRCGLLLPL